MLERRGQVREGFRIGRYRVLGQKYDDLDVGQHLDRHLSGSAVVEGFGRDDRHFRPGLPETPHGIVPGLRVDDQEPRRPQGLAAQCRKQAIEVAAGVQSRDHEPDSGRLCRAFRACFSGGLLSFSAHLPLSGGSEVRSGSCGSGAAYPL